MTAPAVNASNAQVPNIFGHQNNECIGLFPLSTQMKCCVGKGRSCGADKKILVFRATLGLNFEKEVNGTITSSNAVSGGRRPQVRRPWQCLNFLPEPQGQGSLRPVCSQPSGSSDTSNASASCSAATCCAPCA